MIALDYDSQAAKRFYKEVRNFSLSAEKRGWQIVVRHDITPDEQRDPTLISRRVYGRPDEFLAVLAAAGSDMADQILPQKTIYLPTEIQLTNIKRRTGFESIGSSRGNDGVPVWSSYGGR